MSNIYIKLFAVQKEVGKMTKDKTAKAGSFNYQYFDINQIIEHLLPILQKNGLLLLQPIEDNRVKTLLIDVESGKEIASSIDLPNITDPQKLGSAITYYRRYTLQSLLGLQAEDDDGNKAVKAQETQVKTQLKTIKTKEELRSFYANLQEPIKTNLKTLITEFSLTLDK